PPASSISSSSSPSIKSPSQQPQVVKQLPTSTMVVMPAGTTATVPAVPAVQTVVSTTGLVKKPTLAMRQSCEPTVILATTGTVTLPSNSAVASSSPVIKSYKIATKLVPTVSKPPDGTAISQMASFSATPTQLVIPSSGTQLAIS